MKSTHDPHLSSLLFVYPVPNQLRKKRIDWNKLDFCFLYKKKGGWKIQKSERLGLLYFLQKKVCFFEVYCSRQDKEDCHKTNEKHQAGPESAIPIMLFILNSFILPSHSNHCTCAYCIFCFFPFWPRIWLSYVPNPFDPLISPPCA